MQQVRIGSVVIHCHRFEAMIEFWSAALRYKRREPANDDWVVLLDPTGRGPSVSFQARDEPAPHRSWIHLDLYSDRQEQEVDRLLGLGASRYPWRYGPGADYVVLEDPDGNLFCVVQTEAN